MENNIMTITNEGLNYFLDVTLSSGTQVYTHYVGLKGTGTISGTDTLASHGWSEITDYSGDRKIWSEGGVSTQSITNSASVASFTINNTVTVAGAFMCTVISGTSGILINIKDFDSPIEAVNEDVITITNTLGAS